MALPPVLLEQPLHKTSSPASPALPSLPSRPSSDPGQLTSSFGGMVLAARVRPKDIFTASGGTEKTDGCTMILGVRGVVKQSGRDMAGVHVHVHCLLHKSQAQRPVHR